MSKNLFPKPVEIEYIALAYNGVTFFIQQYMPQEQEPIGSWKEIFFFGAGFFLRKSLTHESLGSLPRRRRPKGDSGGMLDKCDESP